jgi:hypothetical protein
MGESISEGALSTILVKEGQYVRENDIIAQVCNPYSLSSHNFFHCYIQLAKKLTYHQHSKIPGGWNKIEIKQHRFFVYVI